MKDLLTLTITCPYCPFKIKVERGSEAAMTDLLDHMERDHQDKLREVAKVKDPNVKVVLDRKKS